MTKVHPSKQKTDSQITFDPEILKSFQVEAGGLVQEMNSLLEVCEGDFSQVKRLEQYGQTVDRIMGGAKSLAVALAIAETDHFINKIGDYAALCKAVGYKASQIQNNERIYEIAVAFLLDATEILGELIRLLDQPQKHVFKSRFSDAFLERLRWLSGQFGAEYRASISLDKGKTQKMTQDEIDHLLKKLGMD